MQPYFLPYIGYFQLIAAVRTFAIYDDAQYIKGGWINRNRVLIHSQPSFITVPVTHASPNRKIADLSVSDVSNWRVKMLNSIRCAYARAPFFSDVYPVVERLVEYSAPSLVEFLRNSIVAICDVLAIPTEILVSSVVSPPTRYHAQERVIEICRSLNATAYVNPIGGSSLYSAGPFADAGMELYFLKPNAASYQQFSGPHIPSLSIIDVLMFNGILPTQKMLNSYSLE